MSAAEIEVMADRRLSLGTDAMLPIGTNRCRCSGCGAYFGGVRAFDMHRHQGEGAERVCLPPGGVADRHGRPKLRKNERGYWCRSWSSRTKTKLRVVP